jgi:GntR family transcriptional repressor for pyruvate dehydrogenase complex
MNHLFEKIAQKKVSDRVFDQVRNLITSGQLRPGDRLPAERELTALLNVSRSSIREAILKLECLGFVAQRHGEGTFVRSVTETPLTDFLQELIEKDDFIEDLMEIRAVLETWGASAAAAHALPEEIAAMEACLEDMRRARGAGRINHALSVRLHVLIASASHNRFLEHVMATISSWIERVTPKVYAATSDELAIYDQLLDQHAAIVAAIGRGDHAGAFRAMTEHLQYAAQIARQIRRPPNAPEAEGP